jgi:hypothetical protein
MSYNAKNYVEQGGDVTVIGGELNVAAGGKITAAGTQADHIADVAITTDLTGVADGTYMTADQAAAIVADFNSIKTKMNAILAALEGVGILKTS